MARKALNLTNGFNYDGTGTGTAVETNATKIDDTLAELDHDIVVVPLVAGGNSVGYFCPPVARTVSAIAVRRQDAVASALGDVTVAVQDGDLNALLNANADGETLTASFVAQALTGTTSRLDLAAGEPARVIVNSTNGDATGGPVVVRITYAAG